VKIISKNQYLAKILLEIYDSANWLFNDSRWLGSDETFLPLLDDNEFLFAYDGSQVVGFLSYHKKCRGHIVITGLYVIKDFQNKGVASGLMAELKHVSADETLVAKVMKTAEWARSFYQKHGFCAVDKNSPISDELSGFIKHNEWSEIYQINVFQMNG
jgi:ribosomal protein S18 acetylase RimI-like enzyme